MNRATALLEALETKQVAVGVIGLGYVGLPLAVAFSKHFKVIGFDINSEKIAELRNLVDSTGEIEDKSLLANPNLSFTDNSSDLAHCRAFLIAVPTPVDSGNLPNLGPLLSACKTIGHVLTLISSEAYISFESTVYPGCTQEECLPLIEKISGKSHGHDFFLGYSPERINPGDRIHRLESIIKVVSGCSEESTDFFVNFYGKVISAGICRVGSIRVAEAAKIIENTQRDINIALINELSIIFSKLGIDTQSVLEAAGTKWNFLPFRPGLVGGHCIGVDPFYLTYKAQMVGYTPRVILAGRAVNDSMGSFIAQEGIKLATKKSPKNLKGYRCLVVGFTFKENVPDIRNTKVIDICSTLKDFNFKTDIIDSRGNSEEAHHEYGVDLHACLPEKLGVYDLMILAVAHLGTREWVLKELTEMSATECPISIVDVKGVLQDTDRAKFPASIAYWRL